jgi:hypothetical protein
MSTGSVTVRLNLNSAGYSAEMTKAEAQMRRLARAGQEFGHSTVSQMQAASASIRVLEGGISNNIRAAERFISMLPGVGAALQAAFPVVGAIALIGVFVRIGEEVSKFISKLNEIPENPFAGMIASSKLGNDALAITNDRLQLEIAKLEHKPQNRMAEALDEMRHASDKLYDSLLKSNKAFDEALGKTKVSTMQGLWRHEVPTKEADQNIASNRSAVQRVFDYRQQIVDDAMKSGNKEDIDQAREAQMKAVQAAYAIMDSNLRRLLAQAEAAKADSSRSYSVGADPSAVVQRYVAALNQSQQDQESIGGQYGESLLQQKKTTLGTGEKDTLLEQWRRELEDLKAFHDVTLADEARFWNQRAELNRSGGKATADAFNEANKVIARMREENMRGQAEFDKNSAINPSSMDLGRGDTDAEKNQGRENAEWLRTMNEGISQRRADAIAITEQSLQMEVLTGRMSKLGEAQALAALHAQVFADAQDRIDEAIAKANNLPDGPYKKTTLEGLNDQRDHVGAQAQMQAAKDQYDVSQQQLGPATRKALDTMVQDWGNMTQGIVQTMTKAVDGLNDQIVNAITGKKTDFGKVFSEAGAGLTKTALQSGEAKIMGAFGLGKPDGTKGNPIHTVNDGVGGITTPPFMGGGQGGQSGQQGGGGSIWSRLFHSFFGGQSNQGGGASSGGGDDDDGGGFDDMFQGAFARGGNFVADRPMLVGEHRADIITPDRAGSVIPLDKIGGDHHTHIHVDARGSSDPMAIEAAVRRATPHILAASVQANHQAKMRSRGGR